MPVEDGRNVEVGSDSIVGYVGGVVDGGVDFGAVFFVIVIIIRCSVWWWGLVWSGWRLGGCVLVG